MHLGFFTLIREAQKSSSSGVTPGVQLGSELYQCWQGCSSHTNMWAAWHKHQQSHINPCWLCSSLPRNGGHSVGFVACPAVRAPHAFQVWGHSCTSTAAPAKAPRHTLHPFPPSHRACFCSQSWMKEVRMQISLILSGEKPLCRQAFYVAACVAHTALAVLAQHSSWDSQQV